MTAPDTESLHFMQDMQAALSLLPKSISPKYFYDQAGSALFDRICELPEYYPTRTELSILQTHADDMAKHMGEQADIIEFGAGSLQKIRLLLNAATQAARFTHNAPPEERTPPKALERNPLSSTPVARGFLSNE